MSNHFISLAQAVEMTTLYRTKREEILDPAYQGQDILFLSEAFSRDAFDALLSEPGAVGLRFYLGMNPDLKVTIIAVATSSDGRDILPDGNTLAETQNGAVIAEVAIRCPPTCPPPPPPTGGLNGPGT